MEPEAARSRRPGLQAQVRARPRGPRGGAGDTSRAQTRPGRQGLRLVACSKDTSVAVPASFRHKELEGGSVDFGARSEWGNGGRAARGAPRRPGPGGLAASRVVPLPRSTLAVRKPAEAAEGGARGRLSPATSRFPERRPRAGGPSLLLSLHRGPGHPASCGGEQRAGRGGFEARCRRRYGLGVVVLRSRRLARSCLSGHRSNSPAMPGTPSVLPVTSARGRRWGWGG